MAGKKELKRAMIVAAPDGYATSVALFGPGDDLPDWAVEQIGDDAYRESGAPDAPINVSEAPQDQSADDQEAPAPSKPAAAKKS